MLKKVAVIMGSDSDWDTVKKAIDCLKEYGVETEVHVMSAHRTPAEACAFAKDAKKNGFGVIIAAAGMAAHLGGVFRAVDGYGGHRDAGGHLNSCQQGVQPVK